MNSADDRTRGLQLTAIDSVIFHPLGLPKRENSRKRRVIDLHCHLLPGIDDGARDQSEALEMARIAASEGTTVVACTPHILPGVYDNTGPAIRAATMELQRALDDAGVPIRLVVGADIHLVPPVVENLKSGQALSLGDSRYVLIEPPHHVLPPRAEEAFFALAAAGYTPILTHPERMSWIRRNYDLIQRLVNAGVLMQLTAGALVGRFGNTARYWSERMLEEGMLHIVATDAHDTKRRGPFLREAYEAAWRAVGEIEANNLVWHRPQAILENRDVPKGRAPVAAKAQDRSNTRFAGW